MEAKGVGLCELNGDAGLAAALVALHSGLKAVVAGRQNAGGDTRQAGEIGDARAVRSVSAVVAVGRDVDEVVDIGVERGGAEAESDGVKLAGTDAFTVEVQATGVGEETSGGKSRSC